MVVKQQPFAMIREMDGAVFSSFPFEGILGLAFPSLSFGGITPFFERVIEQKLLPSNEFSFYLNVDRIGLKSQSLQPAKRSLDQHHGLPKEVAWAHGLFTKDQQRLILLKLSRVTLACVRDSSEIIWDYTSNVCVTYFSRTIAGAGGKKMWECSLAHSAEQAGLLLCWHSSLAPLPLSLSLSLYFPRHSLSLYLSTSLSLSFSLSLSLLALPPLQLQRQEKRGAAWRPRIELGQEHRCIYPASALAFLPHGAQHVTFISNSGSGIAYPAWAGRETKQHNMEVSWLDRWHYLNLHRKTLEELYFVQAYLSMGHCHLAERSPSIPCSAPIVVTSAG